MKSAPQPSMAYATIMEQHCSPLSGPCLAVECVFHGMPCCTEGPHGRDSHAEEAP